MFEADPPYEEWGKLVTADNVHEIDPAYGFNSTMRDSNATNPMRPFSFRLISDKIRPLNHLCVNVLDAEGTYTSTHRMPGISLMNPEYTPGCTFPVAETRRTLQTDIHSQPVRESFERLLAGNPYKVEDMPPIHVVFGEHPLYPGREAFYIGAVLVGTMSTKSFDPRFLPKGERVTGYYPATRSWWW